MIRTNTSIYFIPQVKKVLAAFAVTAAFAAGSTALNEGLRLGMVMGAVLDEIKNGEPSGNVCAQAMMDFYKPGDFQSGELPFSRLHVSLNTPSQQTSLEDDYGIFWVTARQGC